MILSRLQVADFDRFWSVFTGEAAELRQLYDSRGVQVFRNVEDEHEIWLLFDWDPERYAAFRADSRVRESMRTGGLLDLPEARFLDHVDDLPA